MLYSVSSLPLDTWKVLCIQFNNHQFDLLWNVTISKIPPQGIILEINMLS